MLILSWDSHKMKFGKYSKNYNIVGRDMRQRYRTLQSAQGSDFHPQHQNNDDDEDDEEEDVMV